MSNKKRLDVLLTERGLAETRSKAQALILAGDVLAGGVKCTKAGEQFSEDTEIEIRGGCPYVSRGGLKLEKALREFGVNPSGYICTDSGASTGGFTDCLLQNGAKKVYAIDVGYGQLAWKIRNDPRVVVMERTNVRYLTHDDVPDAIDLAVVDVSFISLHTVLPVIKNLLASDGQIVCLIKPQFEAGKGSVGKKGVVRDEKVHLAVLEHFTELVIELSMTLQHLTFSPVKGPEGNIEFLAHLSHAPNGITPDLQALVAAAHETLQ